MTTTVADMPALFSLPGPVAPVRPKRAPRSAFEKAQAVTRVQEWRLANPEAWAAQRKRQQEKNRTDPRRIAQRRNRTFQKKYGMTLADYEAMVQSQDGKCAGCHLPCADLQVDHCHANGQVRGLLCGPCNMALGLMKDDPATAMRLASYLEHYGSGQGAVVRGVVA